MTASFAKVSIKGEGDSVGWCCIVHPHHPATCGYCLKASMTVWWDCLVFTLTFDSSPIKGEGILSVGVGLFTLITLPPVDTALKPV